MAVYAVVDPVQRIDQVLQASDLPNGVVAQPLGPVRTIRLPISSTRE